MAAESFLFNFFKKATTKKPQPRQQQNTSTKKPRQTKTKMLALIVQVFFPPNRVIVTFGNLSNEELQTCQLQLPMFC